MSRGLPIAFLPNPPAEYNQQYFSQVIRTFSVFAEQSRVPGPQLATTLRLTNLSVFADNAAAVAGGLIQGELYRTAAGELRVVV